MDSADTGSSFDSDSDESLISPGWSPGVLDKEELDSVEDTVSDGEDSVIEGGSAVTSGDDSRLVSLEGKLVGLNGDGDWSYGKGSLELGWVVLSNHGEVNVGNLSLGLVVLAGKEGGLGSVWVVGLGLEWVLLNVHESEWHGATLASVVQPGAVNKLLLGEGDKLLGLDEVHSFDGSGGGESPA